MKKLSKKRLAVYIAVAIFLVICIVTAFSDDNPVLASKQDDSDTVMTIPTIPVKGDNTIYGLACEGCNDSVVYLLPEDNSDPIKFDILEATRSNCVKGNIKVGDWIAVVPDSKNKKKGVFVVDLEQLKGIWCYIVMPKLRDFEHMSNRAQAKKLEEMPDSVKQTYYIPREYGFWLKSEWQASSVGYVREQSALEEESPVVYQPLGFFVGWHIWNGKFVMTSGTPVFKDGKGGVKNLANDTCNIDFLSDDSLVLSDRDGSRSYYKKASISEVNKKAQQMAEQLSKKALEETQK